MDDDSEDKVICENCETPVEETDEFCQNCGSIFIEDVHCFNHPVAGADGVCVICRQAYCSNCGLWVDNYFLCNDHQDYEIIEGMAVVYQVGTKAQSDYVFAILEEAGLHPFLYSRNAGKDASGIDYVIGTRGLHEAVVNKVLVPYDEISKAEEIINDIKEEQ